MDIETYHRIDQFFHDYFLLEREIFISQSSEEIMIKLQLKDAILHALKEFFGAGRSKHFLYGTLKIDFKITKINNKLNLKMYGNN